MNNSFGKQLRSELFPGSDIVRRYTFKMIDTRSQSALLARENRQLADNIAMSGDSSAHFENQDCFECLSPREIAV